MSHAKALTLFFDISPSCSGSDDEVSTIAMRPQTSFGASIRLYLKAYVVLKRRSSVVVKYESPRQQSKMSNS